MVEAVRIRVTKLLCPTCEGSGQFLADFVCPSCRGERRISVDDAIRYADWTYVIAGGGYVAGDHDLDDMRRMEARAEAIYALVGRTPPWGRSESRGV